MKTGPNKKLTADTGEVVWDSRSVAVCAVVIRPCDEDETDIEVLSVLRGPDVSHCGKWCLPCGYLDWGETIHEGAIREIKEETGYDLDIKKLEFIGVDSRPEMENQNVTAHFLYCLMDETQVKSVNNNEVQEVKWVKVSEHTEYEWAFDHKTRVNSIIQNG